MSTIPKGEIDRCDTDELTGCVALSFAGFVKAQCVELFGVGIDVWVEVDGISGNFDDTTRGNDLSI